MSPKVLIVDDQIMIRDSLHDLLAGTGKFEIMPPCATGQEALEAIDRDRPDVILMDIRMPGMSGIETLAAMRERAQDDIAVIFLTLFDEPELVFGAVRQNVAGFLLKHIDQDQLIRSIEIVVNGGVVFDPDVATQITRHVATRPFADITAAETDLPHLSAREIEVVTLLSKGYSNKEIASRLDLSAGTVRNYVSTIIEKLGVENRTQAVLHAFNLGLLHPY